MIDELVRHLYENSEAYLAAGSLALISYGLGLIRYTYVNREKLSLIDRDEELLKYIREQEESCRNNPE